MWQDDWQEYGPAAFGKWRGDSSHSKHITAHEHDDPTGTGDGHDDDDDDNAIGGRFTHARDSDQYDQGDGGEDDDDQGARPSVHDVSWGEEEDTW